MRGFFTTTGRRILGGTMALAALAPLQAVKAQSYNILYAFQGGTDAANPNSALVRDKAGNLYSTTISGGTRNEGAVFELAPDGTETVLHSFTGGSDGSVPQSGVIADKNGNLYGTTYQGGSFNRGIVYEVPANGTYSILYTFKGGSADGGNSRGNLYRDKKGNLYGATQTGGGTGGPGGNGCGTVFKLTPKDKETILYSFTCANDGGTPSSSLIADKKGNLYGIAQSGGINGEGVVFKVSLKGVETVLHAFADGTDGAQPQGGLVFDKAGNLYGVTDYGGPANCGTVFKIATDGTESIVYAFTADAGPQAAPILDKAGNLYGTTEFGGPLVAGSAFMVTPEGVETDLHTFGGSGDGKYVLGGLIADSAGNLYGTTLQGPGSNCNADTGCGTVFEIGK